MLGCEMLKWVKQLSKNFFIVICVGGGTQINKAFMEAGLPIKKHGPLGRETNGLREKQLARDILENNQAEIQDRLADMGVQANVVIPVMEIGTVLCHVNGDQFVLAAYHGFDVLYVVTTKEREKEKSEFFAPYKKIKVVTF